MLAKKRVRIAIKENPLVEEYAIPCGKWKIQMKSCFCEIKSLLQDISTQIIWKSQMRSYIVSSFPLQEPLDGLSYYRTKHNTTSVVCNCFVHVFSIDLFQFNITQASIIIKLQISCCIELKLWNHQFSYSLRIKYIWFKVEVTLLCQ